MTEVPRGTVTVWPSIVSVTVTLAASTRIGVPVSSSLMSPMEPFLIRPPQAAACD